ncbi:uncharacterized protein [Parasteatoda tepidariorum]|uniref:uncharacterized protein isoform X1 n=3 Tax=Parasteatoda tepidariorum TaxID=114398 RepID=UPI001C729C6B|nr:uncharacterized protein LOC107457015 isoform X1 [Parasteatoda tepidariorum]
MNVTRTNSEEYDSIQLCSMSELLEIYYQMLKSEMSVIVKDIKLNSFDGKLQDKYSSLLVDFSKKHEITPFSQSLAELLTLLEWKNERNNPQVEDSAVYNSLLQLERVAKYTSSWELFEKECTGPLIDISTFEMNMLEQNLSMYLIDLLRGNPTQPLFFPLKDFQKSEVIIKWRILEKIATINITPRKTIYKQKLTDELTKRIQNEVRNWLQKEFQSLKLTGKNTALKDVESLTKIIKELRSQVTICIDVVSAEGTLFEAASCSYLDCVSKTINEELRPVCLKIMKAMDIYQEYHKTFHVNLRDSCVLSHALYRQLKSLVYCLHIENKTSENMDFKNYSSIFMKLFMNLLHVMKSECHHRIKRAVDESKDFYNKEEGILSSSVIVLNCFCTVIDEWKHMEISDEDLQIAFLIKIVDIICDGAKIYAESLDDRLEKILQVKELEFVKMSQVYNKAVILANSVDHVREFLKELSIKMQWEESLSLLNDALDCTMKKQVLRILNLVHQSMDIHLDHVIMKMLDDMSDNLVSVCEKQLSSWMNSPSSGQAYERIQIYLNEYLENLKETIRDNLFPKFLSLLWSAVLNYAQKRFLEGEPPEYAESLKKDIEYFREYFLYIGMLESDSYKAVWQQIMSLIDLNSKSTVDLQLDYYTHIAESLVSPVEYLGHIAFQAGYKITGQDTIDLYINVQKGQRLPARSFEMSELHVKLALCPSSMFPNHVPLKTAIVTEDLDNPVFNELFQFSKLPTKVLSVKGAVVQVHVLNQDSSYSAEAVLLLKQVQNMSGFTSLEFLPVYLMPLKKFEMSEISFQVLESRSRWDKSAKHFINSRMKTKGQQKTLLSCIPGKNSCFL